MNVHDRDDIMGVIAMLQDEHLDVRAVNLGIDLFDCADRDIDRCCTAIYNKVVRLASPLPDICRQVSDRFGIPIVNTRVSLSPMADVLAGHDASAMLQAAHTLDRAAAEAGLDMIGGFSALVHKGMSHADRVLIGVLPEVLTSTERLCASVNAASSRSGINVDALILLGHVWRDTAQRSADRDGFGCAKLSVFANIPEDNPFMAGSYKGIGEAEAVINIGVSGPGVVKRAIERLLQRGCNGLGDVAAEIKSTAFRVTRCGELIGREVARLTGAAFGIVDLSLAPTPAIGDSIGEIFQAMGITQVGGPGTTAALAMLNDAVKKGGAFASSSVGGLSGAFIPVAEDGTLSAEAARGHLTLEKLEAMTSVCSVGLDMVALPGDTPPETLTALAMDELAIGVINHKTTSVRIIPVPGKRAGDRAVFGGLFGEAPIMPIQCGASDLFVRLGGRIPAPLTSLTN